MLPLLLFTLSCSASAASPSVQISAGLIKGSTCQNNPHSVYFKSIPYAEAPVGQLRFKSPQPWTGHFPVDGLNATAPSPPCIQFGTSLAEPPPYSEDCLHLNIWAPANATENSQLPVRVFVYGGHNQYGGKDDPLYDGCMVPDTGAILVSMNYRLGPLGFLVKRDAEITGNQGILDIMLALQWVQTNIGSFGGDKGSVMLSGQSAGAENSFILSTLPGASKLFGSAAFESAPLSDLQSLETADQLGSQYLNSLNCTSGNAALCLQSASVDDLRIAYSTLPLLIGRKYPALAVPNATSLDAGFQPCVDGTFITEQPLDIGSSVPAVFGTNSLEGTLFAFLTFLQGYASVTQDAYNEYLRENFGSLVGIIQRYYPWSAFQNTPYPGFFAISTIFTQAMFFCPTHRALKATTASGNPAWTYLFSHSPHCSWLQAIPEKALPLLNATHTAELDFVFGNQKNLPSPNGTCGMTGDEINISNFMSQSWTALAKYRHPLAEWPSFNDNRSLGVNFLNSSMSGAVNYTACMLWDKISEMTGSNQGNSTNYGSTNTTANGTTSPPNTASIASSLTYKPPLICLSLTLAVLMATAFL